MRKNTPNLTESERDALEEGYRKSSSHCYRQRCQLILLKAEGRYSNEVASILAMSYVSVNAWVKRYKNEGIAGLQTKPGRGRKVKTPLDKEQDELALRQAIAQNRQRLELAKQDFVSQTGKTVPTSAFRAFLKDVVHDINE